MIPQWFLNIKPDNPIFEGKMEQNPEDLLKLVHTTMPFGRYSGRALIDLPEPYVVWFYGKGLPKGELGRLLGLLYEIKVNGLEYLFKPLRDNPASFELK